MLVAVVVVVVVVAVVVVVVVVVLVVMAVLVVVVVFVLVAVVVLEVVGAGAGVGEGSGSRGSRNGSAVSTEYYADVQRGRLSMSQVFRYSEDASDAWRHVPSFHQKGTAIQFNAAWQRLTIDENSRTDCVEYSCLIRDAGCRVQGLGAGSGREWCGLGFNQSATHSPSVCCVCCGT